MKHDKAFRRAQTARLKNKRKHYWAYPRLYDDHIEEMSKKTLGKVVRTPQVCSAYCCGNQRHAWGKTVRTLQEQRFIVRKSGNN